MKTVEAQREEDQGGITIGNTTTSEDGGYIAEIPSEFDMSGITISVSGGVNALTNEPSDFTAEIIPAHFGTNVTPVTKIASELVKQGENPKKAKEKVVDLVKSLVEKGDIDGREINETDLFEGTMSEMLLREGSEKELVIKTTAFQLIETSLKMFADARSGAKLRNTTSEDKSKALKDVVKALRVIEVNEGEILSIDELADKSFKKMIESDASLIGTSIDAEDSYDLIKMNLESNKRIILEEVETAEFRGLSAIDIVEKVERNRKDADIESELLKDTFRVDVESCAGNKECAGEKVEEKFNEVVDSKMQHREEIKKQKEEGKYVSPIVVDLAKIDSIKQTRIKQTEIDNAKREFTDLYDTLKSLEKSLSNDEVRSIIASDIDEEERSNGVKECIASCREQFSGEEYDENREFYMNLCVARCRINLMKKISIIGEGNESLDNVISFISNEEDMIAAFNKRDEHTNNVIDTIKMEIEEEGLKFDTRSFDVVDRLRSQITGNRFCCIVAPSGKCCNTIKGNFVYGKDPVVVGPIGGEPIGEPMELPFEKIPALSDLLNNGEELGEAQDFISSKEEGSFPFEGVFEKTGEKKSDVEYWKGWYKNEQMTDKFTKEEMDMLLEYFDSKKGTKNPTSEEDILQKIQMILWNMHLNTGNIMPDAIDFRKCVEEYEGVKEKLQFVNSENKWYILKDDGAHRPGTSGYRLYVPEEDIPNTYIEDLSEIGIDFKSILISSWKKLYSDEGGDDHSGKEPVKEEPVKVTYKTGDGMVKFKKWMDYIFEKYALPQEFSLPTNESEFDARFKDMKSATEQLFEEAKLVEAEPWEMRIAQNYINSWLVSNRFGGEEPNETSEHRLRDLYREMFSRVFETIELFRPLGNKESFADLQVRRNRINYYISEYSKFDSELDNAKTEFLNNNDQVWRISNTLSYLIRKIYGEYYKTLVDNEWTQRSNSNGKKLLVNVDDFNNIKLTSEGIEFESTPVSVDNIKEVSTLGGNYYYELEEGAYEEIGTNKFKVSILKGKDFAGQRNAFLPGLIYRAQDASWQSFAVLYVGLEECGSYTMTPITLSISTHGFHNQHTVLHNEVDLTISNFRKLMYSPFSNYFGEIHIDGDSNLDTFEDIKDSKYWNSRFEVVEPQYAKVYDFFNGLSILNVGDVRVNPCDGYVKLESNNSNLGYYKTIEVVGPYDVEYKDCLYGKFNMEIQANEVFELVEGEYVKYSGKVYASSWNVPLTLADKIRENRNAEYYESVDGILLRYNAHMNYGLGNSGRGFKTCEGLEKNDTYEVHGTYFASNRNLFPYWEGKTVILKEKDGTIISEQTVDKGLISQSSTGFLNSGRHPNDQFLVSVNSNGSTVTITFESDSTYSNSSNYYSTDSKGKIDYQASTQCVDADGDQIPATVDLDDNDPSVGGDTDRDGIADHEDVFPFDAGTAYTLVRDIETNEQKVVNANLVKFAGTADYMFYIEYPSEGKEEKEKEERSMPIIFGFEIISTSTEDYDVSLSRFNLEPGKRFNLDFSDQQSEILERVQEVRNKYNSIEKGGFKK